MTAEAFAPGRVNLLGEHTDYNGGLCLPFAIERGVRATFTPAGDELAVEARALGERDRFDPRAPGAGGGWRGLVRGCVAELDAAGRRPPGGTLEIASDLPIGAGLGSSGALCVAVCVALLGERPEPWRLAELCARVEATHAGAQTGLLDQLASLEGRAGHALLLNLGARSLSPVPIALGDWRLVVLESGADRRNASSGYNSRRAECERATRLLGVASLSDAAPAAADGLPPPLDRRVRHVLEENERVRVAARDPSPGALAPLLDASHASLRELYEVSVPEVERTVAAARDAGAAGARIHGGGFGGGVLALFAPGVEPPRGGLRVSPSAGARIS